MTEKEVSIKLRQGCEGRTRKEKVNCEVGEGGKSKQSSSFTLADARGHTPDGYRYHCVKRGRGHVEEEEGNSSASVREGNG